MGTLLSCPLLKANKANATKAAKARLDKTPKYQAGSDASGAGLITPDTKRQRTVKPGGSTASAKDLSGTLIYMGTGMCLLSMRPAPPCASVQVANMWAAAAPAVPPS
jgi:hypothetical protein